MTIRFVVLGFLIAVGAAADWPAFRGPRGDGWATAGLPAGSEPLGLAERWRRPLGSGYSGMAVADGVIVTAAREGDVDLLWALDAETGAERWRIDLGPTYAGHDGSHDGPIATPLIADGRAFMVSARGRLVAAELESGAVAWSRELAADFESEGPFYGWASSPRVVGDLVVLWAGGDKGHVAAFDRRDGSLVWKQLEESTDAQSPMVATVAGREQVVVIGGDSIAGLDPGDGAVLWRLEHKGGQGAMGAPTSSPLLLGDDRILFKHSVDASMVVKVTKVEGGFEAAVEREIRGLNRSYSPPALVGDVVLGYTGRYLSALDPAAGSLLWRSREPGDGFLTAVGDHVVVVTKEGSVHLAPASREGWAEVARLEVFDDLVWAPPAISGSSVFLKSLGGIARVELVRSAAPSAAAALEIPAVLAALAAEVAESTDATAAVTRFMAGKQLPLVDGEVVTFLYRGAGDDLAIAGDMIGMRREEPMHRLGKTDLWWWSTTIDRRARLSYTFLVDNEPRPDPSHPRRVAATVLGPDLNWQRGIGLEMSWFAMPEWPGNTLPSSPARGAIERFEVAIARPEGQEGEPFSAGVTAWLPPGYDAAAAAAYPVAYVIDRNAFEAGNWRDTLDRVVGRTVRPLIVVFVAAPRMPAFDQAFVSVVVPAVEERFRIDRKPANGAVVGMGFGSHQALLLALQHPARFGNVALQSYYATESMIAEVEAAAVDGVKPRVYLEWGRWDLRSPHEQMDMKAAAQQLDRLLRDRGWPVSGGEVLDSTDFASWRNRTDVVLESLFPIGGAAPANPWLASPSP